MQVAACTAMHRLLLPLCLVTGCAGAITSALKPDLSPRTAGAITLATGLAVGALATAMWIDDEPGSSSGCGGANPDGSGSFDSSGSSGSWDTSDDCWPSRVGAVIFAVPTLVELFTGTRSLITNTYPFRNDDAPTP